MPIPPVFGTEHEFVIHIAAARNGLTDKFEQEMLMAERLLKRLSGYFFAGLTVGSDEMNLPSRELESRTERERRLDVFCRGYMTPLGSRFYIDHGYFEFSSPECDDPFVQLACQIAQEELIAEEFEKLFGNDPLKPRLYKNVSDGNGHSQAAHRNFCLTADGWRRLTSSYEDRQRFLYPRLGVTRETKLLATWHVIEQILTGAGKFGDEYILWHSNLTEEEKEAAKRVFQISGRADFIEAITGSQTTHDRPLINQRDEPLADPNKYGRYHCICGDANRAEWPHLFKMGLTAIVLGMIEDDFLDMDFYISDPVKAVRNVSRDTTCKNPVEVSFFSGAECDGFSPLKIMMAFLDQARKYIASRKVPVWCEPIYEKAVWAAQALENEPSLLERMLDWKIKERICRIGRKNVNPFLRHVEYHALTGSRKFYQELCDAGEIETVISRDMIEKYKINPPETSRAYFRGQVLKHFYRHINFYLDSWEWIVFNEGGIPGISPQIMIIMPEPLALTKKKWGDIFEGEVPPTFESFKNMVISQSELRKRRDD